MEIERSDDTLAAIGCGVLIATLINDCDVAHIAAGRPSIMPFLRDGHADKLSSLLREHCERNPEGDISTAVAAAYSEMRDALMRRPKMH